MSGKRLPDILIIGAQKAGTSWLKEQLRAHPGVFMPRDEVHFFDHEDKYAKGSEWYADQFADGFYIAGRSRLDPETARTLLLTCGLVPVGGPVEAEVTFFHQRVESLIQYAFAPDLGRWAPDNVDRFRSTGVDTEYFAPPPAPFSMWGRPTDKRVSSPHSRPTWKSSRRIRKTSVWSGEGLLLSSSRKRVFI